jgi:hypothetical protein
MGKKCVRIIPKQFIVTLKDWSSEMKAAFKVASNIITNANKVKRVENLHKRHRET